jgi:colanic acid/amylovoran biosynthesis glycosyltransferase
MTLASARRPIHQGPEPSSASGNPADVSVSIRRCAADESLRPDRSAQRLRVAYLVNQYPATSLTFIRREIRALEAQGVEVVRLSVRRSGSVLVADADREELERTTVLLDRLPQVIGSLIRCAFKRPRALTRAILEAVKLGWRSDRGVLLHFAYLAQACLVVEHCRRLHVDHLHAHFGTNPAIVALLSRRLGGPRYSLTIHGPEEFDRPRQLRLGSKVQNAEFVVAISEFTRSQLCRWARFEDWNKVEVIRCGLDSEFLDVTASPVPSEPRLICVGRLCEQKGQMNLIEAAFRLRESGIPFELTLVGDGPLRPLIEKRINERKLEGSVILAGWKDGVWIRERILASRAMVLPSFAEGLPVVLMEALVLSRPVVTTFIAGIPELVEPSVNGWLVPAGSVPALVRAMKDVLTADPSRLTAMGQAGAAKVNALHNARTEAARLSQLFARSGPPGRDSAHTPDSACPS